MISAAAEKIRIQNFKITILNLRIKLLQLGSQSLKLVIAK